MTDQEVCQWNSGSSVNFNGEEMYISSFLPSNCNTAYPLCIYEESEPVTAMSAVLVGLSLRDPTVILISCDTCISRWFSSKKPIWQCRSRGKCRFHPWGGKIPWSRKRHLSSSILAWEIPWIEERTVHGVTKSKTERLSLHTGMWYLLTIFWNYVFIPHFFKLMLDSLLDFNKCINHEAHAPSHFKIFWCCAYPNAVGFLCNPNYMSKESRA